MADVTLYTRRVIERGIQIASHDLRSEICPSREERDRVLIGSSSEMSMPARNGRADRFPGGVKRYQYALHDAIRRYIRADKTVMMII